MTFIISNLVRLDNQKVINGGFQFILTAVHPEFAPTKSGGLKHGIEFTSLQADCVYLLQLRNHIEKSTQLYCWISITLNGQTTDASRAYVYIHLSNQEKGVVNLISTEKMTKAPREIVLSKKNLQDSLWQTEDYANIRFRKE